MSIMYCSAVPSSRTTPPRRLVPVWKQSRHNKEKEKKKNNTKGEAAMQRKNKKAISFHALSEMGCLDHTVAFHTAWVCSTGLVQWINPESQCLHPKNERKKKNTGLLPCLLDLLFELWQAGSLEGGIHFYHTMQTQRPVKWHRLSGQSIEHCADLLYSVCENLTLWE